MGAAAELDRHPPSVPVAITLVAPDTALVIAPRLYESDLTGVRVPLPGVLGPLGAAHRQATVVGIDTGARRLSLSGSAAGSLEYDQLILAIGSHTTGPPGSEHAHGADTFIRASALQAAVAAGPQRVIVVGGDFTGLELATEIASGLGERSEVTVLERAATVAPQFGPRGRAIIEDALAALGVRVRPAADVQRVGPRAVWLAGGERLEADLVVVATGPRAPALLEQVGGERDRLGRLVVGPGLQTAAPGVWAAGDSAHALVDGEQPAMMSCQHASPMGLRAGANAAAALRGAPPGDYRQPLYVTCLDLGAAGALVTSGFARDDVIATGEEAKRIKRFINRSLIYPPVGDRDALLKRARQPVPGRRGAAAVRALLRAAPLRDLAISRAPDRAAEVAGV